MNETLLFALKVSLERISVRKCAMIAENSFRERHNNTLAYTEDDFLILDKKLNDILNVLSTHSNEIDNELIKQLKEF